MNWQERAEKAEAELARLRIPYPQQRCKMKLCGVRAANQVNKRLYVLPDGYLSLL